MITPSSTDRQATDIRQEWLDEARQTGEGDTYASKRSQPRFTWRAQLDVCAASGAGCAKTYLATGCNVSVTGVQFRCREKIEPFTEVQIIRAGATDRVPAVVRHYTQTVNGYLIGAEFVN